VHKIKSNLIFQKCLSSIQYQTAQNTQSIQILQPNYHYFLTSVIYSQAYTLWSSIYSFLPFTIQYQNSQVKLISMLNQLHLRFSSVHYLWKFQLILWSTYINVLHGICILHVENLAVSKTDTVLSIRGFLVRCTDIIDKTVECESPPKWFGAHAACLICHHPSFVHPTTIPV
jgi:hypothetical protein